MRRNRQSELAGMARSTELLEKKLSSSRSLRAQKFRRRAPSKRSAVTEFQARTLALLIDTIERAALRHFNVPAASRLPVARYEEFFALPEYRLFIEGSYACGFVCKDFSPEGPVVERPQRAEEAVNAWTFFELRHQVHTLLRSERWADGYSSPIVESLTQGALSAMSRRLSNEDALYEPN